MNTLLHVGNLSVETTAASLTEVFERDGSKVTKVDLVLSPRSGRPRGFAFVGMANEEEARKAVQVLDGAEVDGRSMRVSAAKAAKSRFGGGNP